MTILQENGLSFADVEANMGVKDLGLRLTVAGKDVVVRYKAATEAGGVVTAEADAGNGLTVQSSATPVDGVRAVVLYVDFPPESPTAQAGVRQSVALFNWTDEPKTVSVLRARLGHVGPVKAENFWTGERETLDGEFITRRLEGRSAVLLEVHS